MARDTGRRPKPKPKPVMPLYEEREEAYYRPAPVPKITKPPTPRILEQDVYQYRQQPGRLPTPREGGRFYEPVENIYARYGGGPAEQQPVAQYIQNPYSITPQGTTRKYQPGDPWVEPDLTWGNTRRPVASYGTYYDWTKTRPRKPYQIGDPWEEPDLTWGNIKPAIYDYVIDESIYDPEDYVFDTGGYGDGGGGGYTINFGGSGTPSSSSRYYGTGLINWRV